MNSESASGSAYWGEGTASSFSFSFVHTISSSSLSLNLSTEEKIENSIHLKLYTPDTKNAPEYKFLLKRCKIVSI